MNHRERISSVIALVVITILMHSYGYADEGKNQYSATDNEIIVDEHSRNIVKAVNIDHLMSDVEWLADDARLGRASGTPSEKEVGDWLMERYSILELKPFRKLKLSDYAHEFEYHTYDDAGIERPAFGENIIGVIEGEDKNGEYVIISSHYDHLGVENGLIFNGADDDASGVAAMLEIARVILKLGVQPKKSIVLVAFTAEEIGRHGSWNLCHAIYESKLAPKMIGLNLEMLGPAKHSRPYVNIWGQGQYATQPIIHAVRLASLEANVDMIVSPSLDPGSDALELLECGVVATSIDMSGGEQFESHHPYYHTPDDKPENIDQHAYLKAVQVAAMATWLLANNAAK